MTWFRVDDGFYDHPKVLGVDVAAIGLWTLAGSYCARHLTDGVITDRQIRAIGGTRKQAEKLVAAGLWTCDDAPPNARRYFFNDWSDYQPSRADVTSRRRDDAERKRAARAARAAKQGKRENVRPDVQSDGARTSPDASDGSPLYPTRPDPTVVTDVTTNPPTPQPSEGGTLVPLRPPRGGREVAERLNATAHSPEAHGIARAYANEVGSIPGKVLGEIAQRADECLRSGVSAEQIARGLTAWHESPITATSQIPGFVHKAGRTPARAAGVSKPTKAAMSALAIAEDLIARGVTTHD